MTTPAPITDTGAIRQFILSPKGEFTLKSKVSGVHCTYQRWDNHRGGMFISYLSGPDETSYLGMVTITEEGDLFLRTTAKSPKEGRCLKALQWFFRNLILDDLDGGNLQKVEFWHSGKCCRCGRTLTTPESIAAGIGPVCATRT